MNEKEYRRLTAVERAIERIGVRHVPRQNMVLLADKGAVGDGVADDTEAIGRAIAEAKLSGRPTTVMAEAGKTYLFNPTTDSIGTPWDNSAVYKYGWVPSSGMTFDGNGATFKLMDNANKVSGFFVQTSSAAYLEDFTIRNCVFDWNGQNNPWTGGHYCVALFWKVKNFRFHDNSVRNNGGFNDILLWPGSAGAGSYGVWIHNNEFLDCADSTGSGTSDHTCIWAVADDTHIHSNRCYQTTTPSTISSFVEIHGSRLWFHDNRMRGCRRGIMPVAAEHSTQNLVCENVFIHHNTFELVEDAILFWSSAGGEVKDIHIDHNTFLDNTRRPINIYSQKSSFVGAFSQDVHDVTISHNHFIQKDIVETNYPLIIGFGYNITIAHNVFAGYTAFYPIRIDNTKQTDVPIATIVGAAGTVTVTTTGIHGYEDGSIVTIAGTTAFNVSNVVITSTGATTFTYASAVVASEAAGTVTRYPTVTNINIDGNVFSRCTTAILVYLQGVTTNLPQLSQINVVNNIVDDNTTSNYLVMSDDGIDGLTIRNNVGRFMIDLTRDKTQQLDVIIDQVVDPTKPSLTTPLASGYFGDSTSDIRDGSIVRYYSGLSSREHRRVNNIWRTLDWGTTDPASAGETDRREIGSLRYNSQPNIGAVLGWICTTAGTPGTWQAFGVAETGGIALVNNANEFTQAQTITVTDAATNTVVPSGLTISHQSTSTPAAGFGTSFTMLGDSSTNTERAMAALIVAWATATDASRKAQLRLLAYDTAAREGIRIETNGTDPTIGFLGANAVARPTVTGSRGGNAALQSLLTALANLGLITDSSS